MDNRGEDGHAVEVKTSAVVMMWACSRGEDVSRRGENVGSGGEDVGTGGENVV